MKIMDFLLEKAVCVDIQATSKDKILEELVDLIAQSQTIKDRERLLHLLRERESLGSTGIGQGVAIPHAKCGSVKKLVAAFGISRRGVDFESLDGEPVYIFFLLLASEDSAGPHLKALARISRLLKDKYFRETLRAAPDEKTVMKVIRQEDARH